MDQTKDIGMRLCELRDACIGEAKRLQTEGRTDETAFARVEANVYDAFSQVWNAACKHRGADAMEFFLQKLTDIPQAWVRAKAEAEAHGGSKKAFVEDIKLRAVKTIRAEIGDMV